MQCYKFLVSDRIAYASSYVLMLSFFVEVDSNIELSDCSIMHSQVEFDPPV